MLMEVSLCHLNKGSFHDMLKNTRAKQSCRNGLNILARCEIGVIGITIEEKPISLIESCIARSKYNSDSHTHHFYLSSCTIQLSTSRSTPATVQSVYISLIVAPYWSATVRFGLS